MLKLAMLVAQSWFPALVTLASGVINAVSTPGTGAEPAAVWWMPLVNTGAIGGVLVWFMWRNEPRLRAIEAAIDRVARALMISVLAMRSCDRSFKDQAQEIVSEVEAAERKP